MPYRFVPPAVPLVPPTVRPAHPAHLLLRHYRPWDAGLNVFLLVDGTVTTVEPGDPALIDTTFHGGHIHTVDDDLVRAKLEAAGYALTFFEAPAPQPGLPGGNYTSPPVRLQDIYSDTYFDTYGVPSGPTATDVYTTNYEAAY